jgi:hypothetical protein
MTWAEIVNYYLESTIMVDCKAFVKQRRTEVEVFPEPKDTFAFTGWIQPEDVKIVIVNFKPELGIDDINKSIKDSLYSYLTDEEFDNIKVTSPEQWGKNGILYLPASLTWEKDCNHYSNGWGQFGLHVAQQLKAPAYLFLGVSEDREYKVSDLEGVIVASKELYNPQAIYDLLDDVKMYRRVNDKCHLFDVDYSDCIDFRKVKNKYIAALKKENLPDEVLRGKMASKETFLEAIHQWIPVHKTISFINN